MVEMVNIYDPGLEFEPIHRLAIGLDIEKLTRVMQNAPGVTYEPVRGFDEAVDRISGTGVHRIAVVSDSGFGLLSFPKPELNLAVAGLDAFLGQLGRDRELEIDYIHGAEAVRDLATQPNRVLTRRYSWDLP